MRRFALRILTLFRFGRAEAELSRELHAHLQLLEDTFIAGGMSPDEARFAARRAFGGQIEQIKERQRDARTFRTLDEWWLDLKLGARMLVKYPGLTVIAVFALSVAIGGGTAYLEFLNDMVRPTLPGRDGDRVVGIYNWDTAAGTADHRSLDDFLAWRTQLTTIQDIGAYAVLQRNLITADGRTEPVAGAEISASAFRLFPTAPLLGRPLVDADQRATAPLVAVIGEPLWQSRFGRDSAIVGKTIRLGADAYTIVGVMPESFGFPVNHSLWVPLRVEAASVSPNEGPRIRVFGRLAPGMSLAEAQAELSAVSARVAASVPDANPHLRPQVARWVTALWGSSQDGYAQLAILYSANLFFLGLLAVCGANVATLVFARTATREAEITVRTALGASRSRIVAQLFAESLVLSLVAMVVGLGTASFALDWGKAAWQAGAGEGSAPPFWWNDQLSTESLIYAGVLALLAAAIVGIVPALKATGAEMQGRLKHAAAGATMKFGGIWTAVIIGQVALTVLFLMSAVSLGWNLYASGYQTSGVGFAADQIVSARLEPDVDPAAEPDAGESLASLRSSLDPAYREIKRRLLQEPGVVGVSYTSAFPGMRHGEFFVEFQDPSIPIPVDDGPLWVRSAVVSNDFFDTLKVPVIMGRGFTPADVEFNRPVVVVDQTFVDLVLGGRHPIGQHVRQPQNSENPQPGPWYEIVGVVRDLSHAVEKTTENAVLYRPGPAAAASPTLLAVHVSGDARAFAPRVRSIAAAADPLLRLYDVMTLDRVDEADQVAFKFFLRVIAIVSGVALVLSAAGVYALLAFTVVRRTREIGIRAAIGANRGRILTGLFSRTVAQVAAGIVIGSVPGTVLVTAGAPEIAAGSGASVGLATCVAVGVFMMTVTMLACMVPARRALRIQPTEALRAEA